MSDMNIYASKIAVLADFYLNYRDQAPYKDFAEYNDIGLPLAYVIHQNLVETNPEGRAFIEETYELLCSAMDIDSEHQYECFEDMLNEQEMGTQEP
jgi:hypothetical protein